jgi:outer membrane protein assembly factor BamE (lipoprotein component of BamABCDE complex)
MKAMVARPRLAITLALGLALGACVPTIDNHGHAVDPDVLSQITPGVTSREEVLRLLGSPSSLSAFDDSEWYYISQRTERMSFYQSEITSQDVVAINFDKSGVVDSVDQHGLDEARAVDPSPDKTKTLGNELSFLQQILGNVGRFNSDQNGPGNRTPQAPGGGF